MSALQQAIDEFRDRRLKVYREDQDQIIRDANSANETARDHVGRWIYELIQNADDAEASTLLVQVMDEAIYVADNEGTGSRHYQVAERHSPLREARWRNRSKGTGVQGGLRHHSNTANLLERRRIGFLS